MAVEIKSAEEIKMMREAGRVVGQTLQVLRESVRPGVTAKNLDDIVRKEYAKRGVTPTFLNYAVPGAPPYPATVCVSVNDEIVHGIPTNKRMFKSGDIVSIDLGATVNGWVGDSAITVGCGKVSDEAQHLIEVTEAALWAGIRASRAGARIGDIGAAVQEVAERNNYSVVREYVGHGVGRTMHQDPQVPNYGTAGHGEILRKGTVIAIEPMVNVGDWHTKRMPDKWTVVTRDGSLSAHFEHTLAVTDGDPEVLTLP
jgi:methionyl aminopeptidase